MFRPMFFSSFLGCVSMILPKVLLRRSWAPFWRDVCSNLVSKGGPKSTKNQVGNHGEQNTFQNTSGIYFFMDFRQRPIIKPDFAWNRKAHCHNAFAPGKPATSKQSKQPRNKKGITTSNRIWQNRMGYNEME